MSCHIRPAAPDDAPAIAEIYNHYVRGSAATLQDVPATAEDFRAMMNKAGAPFLAAEEGSEIVGYCYADVMKSRCGYRYTYENSVYVSAAAAGRGIGRALLTALLAALQETRAHKVVAVISLPNPASVALHEKLGFVYCGTLPGAGWKCRQWVDCGYWMLRIKEGEPG